MAFARQSIGQINRTINFQGYAIILESFVAFTGVATCVDIKLGLDIFNVLKISISHFRLTSTACSQYPVFQVAPDIVSSLRRSKRLGIRVYNNLAEISNIPLQGKHKWSNYNGCNSH